MARFKNAKTGVVVNVPDKIGAGLPGYKPVGTATGRKAAAEKAEE